MTQNQHRSYLNLRLLDSSGLGQQQQQQILIIENDHAIVVILQHIYIEYSLYRAGMILSNRLVTASRRLKRQNQNIICVPVLFFLHFIK